MFFAFVYDSFLSTVKLWCKTLKYLFAFFFQTREEKKTTAIVKVFEKMAKREERRKHALAQEDKRHDLKVNIFVKSKPLNKRKPSNRNLTLANRLLFIS